MTYLTPLENENINDLEKAKFEQIADLIYLRVKMLGFVKVQALTQKIEVLNKDVSDVEIELTSLLPLDTNVNAVTITNEGDTNSFFYSTQTGFTAGYSDGSILVGKRIGAGESQNIPINSNVKIYVKCETGKSTRVEFAQWI